jgi:tetratricopeptide (TPR) repeat protein
MNRAFIYGFALIVMTACATVPKETQQVQPKESTSSDRMKEDLIHTEEEIKSLDIFNEIFAITRSGRDRQSILPKIEALYMEIIKKYPETPLAQESHWRLINIYINDYSPPDYDKAEIVYHDFLKNNHDSPLKGVVEDTLGRSYVKHAEWNRLLTLSSPSFSGYVEKKITPKASLMFMYAEANYNLGNIEQAEKAYLIVSDLFPELRVGKKSKTMIEEIGKKGN